MDLTAEVNLQQQTELYMHNMTKRSLHTVLRGKYRTGTDNRGNVNSQLVLLILLGNWKINTVTSSMCFVTLAETKSDFFSPQQTKHTESDPMHRPADSGLALTESGSFTHRSLRTGWGLGKQNGRVIAPLAFPLPLPSSPNWNLFFLRNSARIYCIRK